MGGFRDTDHLYRVLDAFFRRVTARAEVANALLARPMVLRFRYDAPAGQVTIDLRKAPIAWTFGDTALVPDLELIQSADVANRFWQGQLAIATAVATRKVVARGPISWALALLPALKPAYPIYVEVLRELGEHALVIDDARGGRGGGGSRAARALGDRVLGYARRLERSVKQRLARHPAIDFDALPAHLVPLVDVVTSGRAAVRAQSLPTEPVALAREMLRRMCVIRAFEEQLSVAWARGEVPTEAIHLSIGQEATAVGVCFALRDDDYVATTHRGHGHMLAKGADLDGMMAEMLGRATGLCGGKGGSMHVTDASVGAIGANGIVGASPLVAAGAAHASRLAGDDRVAVAFLGDGATNQGMFHEALNFAAVLDLPVLFVVENNLYGEFTPLARHTRAPSLAGRAAAYGVPGVVVDGNDVRAVFHATRDAIARARRGEGPTLLECRTYRWHGHMEGESVAYRSAEEIAAWKARCPIAALARALEAEGALDAAAAEAESRAAAERIALSWQRAQQAPPPDAAALTTDVYAPEPRSLYTATPLPSQPAPTRELTCSRALFDALAEELERDASVYLLGEDVTTGGYFAVTTGLVERFGRERIVDTPISEYAIVGSAVGAAMVGRRPVCEILFSDFLTTCMDPLVNQAAKLRYMSGGQYSLPLVVRTPGGAGLGMAAQHSQSLEALLTGVAGLIVIAPATAADAKGLLKAAIRSNNPVVFFENKLLYAESGPVPEGDYVVPIGVADVKRAGTDVTLVTVGAVLSRALEAARELERDGVSVEVVDVRTLVPLDLATILRSVAKTGRLVTLEDAPRTHGFGAEIVARVVEVAHRALRAAPRRVAGLDVPLAYDAALENAALPNVERIVTAIRAVMA
jgi:2-oxoisovalerate dehydrogenase E1 component